MPFIKQIILYTLILGLLPVTALGQTDEEAADELGNSKNNENNAPFLNKNRSGAESQKAVKGKIYEEKMFQFQGYVYGLVNYYDEYDHCKDTKSQTSSMELNLEMNFKPAVFFGLHLDGGGKINTEEDNTQPADNNFVTNEGYIGMYLGLINMTCGKKRTIIGSGIVLEPLDIVNPQRSLPGQNVQKEGNYLTQLNISNLFNNKNFNQIYFDAIYYWPVEKDKNGLPEKWLSERENLTLLSRLGVVLFECDMALYYIHKWETDHFGLSFSRYIFSGLEFHLESLMFNKRHPVLNQLYLSDEKKFYSNIITGLRYTGISRFVAGLDFYYQQDGLNQSEWDRAASGYNLMRTKYFLFNASKTYERSPNLTLRKYYLASNINYTEILDYFNCNLTAIYGLDDNSFLVFPKIDYLPGSNTSLGIGALLLAGKGNNYQYKLFNFEYMAMFDAAIHF